MRILFICGINNYEWQLKGWKKDLSSLLPENEVIFLSQWYLHPQRKKINTLVQKGISIMEDCKPTIIIAHSFGGILAKSIIAQSKNHNIQKLITMASPHQMNMLKLKEAKTYLQTPESVNTKTLTFGGIFDPIVPFWKTHTKNSIHKNFWCNHWSFLYSKKIRKKIIKMI